VTSEKVTDVWDDWQEAVNISPGPLELWLGSDDDVTTCARSSGTCTGTWPNGPLVTSRTLRGATR